MRMGYILLEGGAEFGGQMAAADRRALVLAGGFHIPVSIIPAAAAPDHNHHRAGQNGLRWFQDLGADNVTVLPLIDGESANKPLLVKSLLRSKFIYLLGGFPHYLGKTLTGSAAWDAMTAALREGAVIAGSSAGAMVLCEYYYAPPKKPDKPDKSGKSDKSDKPDKSDKKVFEGLRLVSGICVLPHHNTFGRKWAPLLAQLIPDTLLVGIDEETGMINDGPKRQWQVYGKGAITLYRGGGTDRYRSGELFTY